MVKPIVGAGSAWVCIVISAFAIVILGVIASLFSHEHHSMVGSTEDPEDPKAVAGAIWGAVLVYLIFLVFCGSQALMHYWQSRRGGITLT